MDGHGSLPLDVTSSQNHNVGTLSVQINAGSFEALAPPPLCQVRRRPVGMAKVKLTGMCGIFQA